MLKTRQKIITIHTLSNISQSKGQAMKFPQLIDYTMRIVIIIL